MATPQGRGWLDLQRYVVTACDQLGGSYDAVATAVRVELRVAARRASSVAGDDAHGRRADGERRDARLARRAGARHGRGEREPLGRAERRDRSRTPRSRIRPRRSTPRSRRRTRRASTVGFAAAAAAHAATTRGAPRSVHHRAERDRAGAAQPRHRAARRRARRGSGRRAADSLGRHRSRTSWSRPASTRSRVRSSRSSSARIDERSLEDWESGPLVAQPMALLCRVLDRLGDGSGDRDGAVSAHLPAGSPAGDRPAASERLTRGVLTTMGRTEIERTVRPSLLDRLTDSEPGLAGRSADHARGVGATLPRGGGARRRSAAEHASHDDRGAGLVPRAAPLRLRLRAPGHDRHARWARRWGATGCSTSLQDAIERFEPRLARPARQARRARPGAGAADALRGRSACSDGPRAARTSCSTRCSRSRAESTTCATPTQSSAG